MNKPQTYTPLPTPIAIKEQNWPSNTEPLVHVRTMVFNHEKYLRTCLDSILMQRTTFPVKILIHDDASTDQSISILKEYAQQYPNLIYVYYQPENTYRLKNKKEFQLKRKPFNDLRVARYEAICEGDDYWTDDLKLQYQADFLETHPSYAGVSHATDIQNEEGRKAKADEFWQLFNEDADLDLSQVVQNKVPFHTSSFFFRSYIVPKITHFPLIAKSGDWVIFTLVALEGNIRYIHRTMSVYRTHTKGITTLDNHFNPLEITLNRYKMWRTLKNYAKNEEQAAIFEKRLRYQRIYLTEEYQINNINEWFNIFILLFQHKEWKGIRVLIKRTQMIKLKFFVN